MTKRYVVTAYRNHADIEPEHFIVWSAEGNPDYSPERMAREKCEDNGWQFVCIGLETSEYNIPRLEPMRWARLQEELRDLDRRCGYVR